MLESEVSVPKLEDIIITASIVFDELNKLKTDKSPGPEGWPLRIFKECSEHLSIPLSILFNKSFQSGVLPSEWRIAFVIPIHKKGSQHLASNYRPVSLTSTVVKVMESIIKTNVLEHLTSNDLLTSHQFGFLRGHSCTTQLLHVMDILTKSLDQGVPIDVVYMDLQKAFDTVPHKRLLYKIEYYGITGNLLRWIAGFLSNRRQCVFLNGKKSSWQDVKSGVPQGSILEPLLFLIYVNDLPRSISSQVFLFADDTKLIRSISTLADHAQLQTDLDNLTKWCDAWQLNFNATKCKVIHFGRATHSYGGYYLNGILLDSVDCYKDLGILFDTGLKFHQHASEVAMKANRVLACMRRGFINLNESVLLRLYKSMVRPILEYGNVIWGPHYILDQRKLEGVQRRATKLVPSLRNESYIDRLTVLNLPSLLYRYRRGDLIFLFKLLNGYFELDYSNFFTLSHNTHTRGHSFKLSKPPAHHLCRVNFFGTRVINDWNNLTSDIVENSSLNSFKSAVDNYFYDFKFMFHS